MLKRFSSIFVPFCNVSFFLIFRFGFTIKFENVSFRDMLDQQLCLFNTCWLLVIYFLHLLPLFFFLSADFPLFYHFFSFSLFIWSSLSIFFFHFDTRKRFVVLSNFFSLPFLWSYMHMSNLDSIWYFSSDFSFLLFFVCVQYFLPIYQTYNFWIGFECKTMKKNIYIDTTGHWIKSYIFAYSVSFFLLCRSVYRIDFLCRFVSCLNGLFSVFSLSVYNWVLFGFLISLRNIPKSAEVGTKNIMHMLNGFCWTYFLPFVFQCISKCFDTISLPFSSSASSSSSFSSSWRIQFIQYPMSFDPLHSIFSFILTHPEWKKKCMRERRYKEHF